MLMHVANSPTDKYPSMCLCGKVKKRPSRIRTFELACRRCMRLVIKAANEREEGRTT